MNSAKIWLITGCLIVAMAAAGAGLALWNQVDNEWQAEASAAEYALNHSPLEKISGHIVFTGGNVQEVFYGDDMFGRKWYTFVTENPLHAYSIPASKVIPKQKVEQLARAARIEPVDVELGYVPASNRLSTKPKQDQIVWEVYGYHGGKSEYVYYDAVSGKRLWQYVLST